MSKQTRNERQQLRNEANTTRINDEVKQIWLSSPKYHLELAVAQFAISMTKNDGSSLLIKDRIAKVEDWGTDCHPNQLLTNDELATAEQITFLVDATKKVVIGELCDGLGISVNDLEGLNIFAELGTAH
jgi:hypothetical protein